MNAADTLTHPLDEVAARIPCSERWLTEQVRAGRIPGRKIGRHWRMTDADIEAALDSFRVTPAGRKSVAPPPDRPITLTPTRPRRR
ncbi:excisionase [Mycobacterium phage MarkPhew]|uniref:Excise n=1 Tax=Mycobacterium phage MarkPhew TaxID=2725625 RepID=A0A6M3SYW5_9CAUD|nr:excisionase [Mycobacterium phage MarkPhew]QJD50348.1 excise [Mycobacterium phage MarkPhew]